MANIIDYCKFKEGMYKKRPVMTCEDCIEELRNMKINATEKQKNAINFAISLIIDFIRNFDDGK